MNLRTEVNVEDVLRLLGGSFTVLVEEELEDNRHVELEGGNGRNVQIIMHRGSGRTQAWLLGGVR